MFERFLSNRQKPENFTELYNNNFDYVYSFVFIRTAYNTQVTEELVQESFSCAWQALDRFQNKSTYRTWLCAIAKNKLYEHYKKSASSEIYATTTPDNHIEQSSDFNLEDVVLKNETRTYVIKALNQLNPIYRYSLIMKYIDGYSVKEIAKHLGRTDKAIDGVLQKAKKIFIKEYLKTLERGDFDE